MTCASGGTEILKKPAAAVTVRKTEYKNPGVDHELGSQRAYGCILPGKGHAAFIHASMSLLILETDDGDHSSVAGKAEGLRGACTFFPREGGQICLLGILCRDDVQGGDVVREHRCNLIEMVGVGGGRSLTMVYMVSG